MSEKLFIKETKSSGSIIKTVVISTAVMIGSVAITYAVMSSNDNQTDINQATNSNITYEVVKTDSPVVGIAAKASPSVVGVKVSYVVPNAYGMLTDSGSEGSGVIYTTDGYIITNYHVIEDAILNSTATITVSFSDGTTAEASIVAGDQVSDIAVIKVEKTDLTKIEIGSSDETLVGELAVAIGNPLGQQFAGSVTVGYISALDRELVADGNTYNMIQTDAAINSGNSGGALVNSEGKLIGINTAKIGATGVEGLGFAIPIDTAIPIVESLINDGKVIRPQIGITGFDITQSDAERYELVEGVYVNEVFAETPASKANIKAGDVIVNIAGTEITTMDELNKIKNEHKVGDTVKITLFRQGTYITVDLVLEEAK